MCLSLCYIFLFILFGDVVVYIWWYIDGGVIIWELIVLLVVFYRYMEVY